MDIRYNKRLQEFRNIAAKIDYMNYITKELLYWDHLIAMPEEAEEYRSGVNAFLGNELYHMTSDKGFRQYVHYLRGNPENDQITNAMIRNILTSTYFADVIPEEEYSKYIQLISTFENVWKKAKEEKNPSKCIPLFSSMFNLFRNFAEYWGYEDTPYDAVMSYYVPGMTVDKTDAIIEKLKPFVLEELKRYREAEKEDDFHLIVPSEIQKEISEEVLREGGFSFKKGRTDKGPYPIVLAYSPYDVRIINDFKDDDFKTSISNMLHSGGKGIYVQSVDHELDGTMLSTAADLHLDEAVGRIYENVIGKSRGFSDYLFEKLLKRMPELKAEDADKFFRYMNRISISPVRLEADELSEVLHVIIRYEIERDFINGKMKAADLEKQWNSKYREYLGVEPSDVSEGFLQDVHWATGYVGLFPSYLEAEITAYQIAGKMEAEIGKIDDLFKEKKTGLIYEWMEKNIFRHGALYSGKELLKKIHCENSDPDYFISYLRNRYSGIYK